MTTEYKRMQQLIGTTAEWGANDLVVGDGELAVEQTGTATKIKIGDGATKFSALPYIGGGDSQFLQAGTGAVARTAQAKMRDVVSVFDFMTAEQIADVQARTALVDTTAAIQAAIDSFGTTGGVVRLPKGKYKTTAKITLHSGVSLIGDGQFGVIQTYDQGTTTIYGVHNGTAILSLVGAVSCTVSDLCLQTAATAPWPQTGLLLGRNTAASAGYHKIIRVSAYGNFTIANVYSIASEDNYWEDLNLWNYALGGAKHCFYTSIGNSNPAMTEPLVTSSNLDNVFVRFWFTNNEPAADAACIYLDNAEGMGSWSFFGGYCTAAGGSYVTINNGAIDGLSALGPFTFSGFNGERLAGGDPLYGFNLLASAPVELRGLFISGARFEFSAGTNHYQLRKQPNLTLIAPNIVLQPPDAHPYALTDVSRDKVRGGVLSIGRDYAWTNVTLATDWGNSYGAPYAPASYSIDANGFVRLRGLVQRSVAGSPVMFTLPATVRPAANMIFTTGAGTSVGQILVNSTTGDVSLLVGTVTDQIDLSPVQFNFL